MRALPLRSIWQIVSEINLAEIQREIGSTFHLLIAADDGSVAELAASSLSGGAADFIHPWITVTDGSDTAATSVTITVTPVNDPPIAGADTGTVDEGDRLSLEASALLANDTDAENDTLRITTVGDAVNGTVSLNGSTILYTHDGSETTAGSFSYTVSDGADTDTATVAITVVPVDDAPVAADERATVATATPAVAAATVRPVGNTPVAADETPTPTTAAPTPTTAAPAAELTASPTPVPVVASPTPPTATPEVSVPPTDEDDGLNVGLIGVVIVVAVAIAGAGAIVVARRRNRT